MALGSPAPAAAVACAAGVYLLSLSSASALSAQASAPKSIWTGTFTAKQADRGLLAYERACSKCHQSDLQGSQDTEAPALVGEPFTAQWGGQSIKDLFDKVSTKMPADKPGSLSANTSLDVVAYLLQANGFPPGGDELDLTPPALAPVIAEKRPSGTKP